MVADAFQLIVRLHLLMFLWSGLGMLVLLLMQR